MNSVEIPEGVKRIASGTFQRCTNLTRVTIPESVTGIGSNAFYYCNKLTSIETLKNVTGIGDYAFFWCSSLTNIELSENLGSIGMYAFDLCGFSSVEIPEEVNVIKFSTFSSSKLTSVTIKASKWLLTIVDNAFYGCRTLNEMRIVVLSDGTFRFPRVVYSSIGGAFDGGLPDERYIRFVDEDGNEVTGQVYDEVFAEAAKNDDDGDDSKWYGWSYKEYIPVKDAYPVTITVQKNNTPWTTHNRTFALTKDSGATFITALDAVEPGTYTIYDVTGVSSVDEYGIKGVNTGVPVNVVNADVSATVDYYTAIFYDLDADGNEVEYGNDTDQRQQTVLKTVGRVTKPVTDPEKTGHTFDKWVTAPNGENEFKFPLTEITAPTKIYAKWKVNTVSTHTVTINVKKDGNPWSNHGRSFALLGGGGSGFLEVPGQTADSSYTISQVPDGTYHIYDITGVPADSLYSRARDTGAEVRVNGADTEVDVTVNGADVEKDVHYYTATFYDGTEAYKAGTPQEPQIILRGKMAAKPEDPQKADWQFAGWKTTDGGSTPYDFDTPVTDITSILSAGCCRTGQQCGRF